MSITLTGTLWSPTIDASTQRWSQAVRKLKRPIQLLEFCGTGGMIHAHRVLNGSMPPNIAITPALSCPVCVAARSEIAQILDLVSRGDVTVCAYDEFKHVVDHRGQSLAQARHDGADVRFVQSPLEVIALSSKQPTRQFVFVASGFETATPHTAVAILEAQRMSLENFSVFVAHRLITPAVLALLESGVKADGLLIDPAAAVIIGANNFRRAVSRFTVPCVISGSDRSQFIEAVAVLCEMISKKDYRLVNLYPDAVTDWGNRRAQNLIHAVFTNGDMSWRGIGNVAHSGRVLRRQFRQYDARLRFNLISPLVEEDNTCRCADVITGRLRPGACPLFDASCAPENPLGTCMASPDGPCAVWHELKATH